VGGAVHLDLTDVRLLVNVAATNSLTRGAERTYLSPPAASARIRNLEDDIGVRLLHRSAQGVTLTVAGQAFVHHARSMLQQLSELHNEMQDYANGAKGHLRICANTTAVASFLPAILRRFLQEHGSVNVELRERTSQQIVRAVSEGTADIGIVAGNVRTEGLELRPYRSDSLVAVVAAGHPAAGGDTLAFSQALDCEFISLGDDSAIHAFLEDASQRLQRNLRVRIQVGNFEALCRMVEAGIGIGIVPELLARRYGESMDIRIVPLADKWALRELQICARSFRLLPAYGRHLVDLLLADAQEGSHLMACGA